VPLLEVKKPEFTDAKLQTYMRLYFGPNGKNADSKVLADFEAKRPVTFERKLFEELVSSWKSNYTKVEEVMTANHITEKAAPPRKKLNPALAGLNLTFKPPRQDN
jgi:hypothetical protein